MDGYPIDTDKLMSLMRV